MDESCMFLVDLTDCSNCHDLCLGPVIFPCGHLFCRKCVRQLIVREGLPAHCSSCHQIIPLVQGETISDIIDNMYNDAIVEKLVYEYLRQVRKTSCDLCHENKVTHVCLDCHLYLCDTCSNVHSVSERSYAHKQQTLPTSAEIQSKDDTGDLEALCRSIKCCQVAEVIAVDTQTMCNEVKMILHDQICQLKNSKKQVDKLITSLQNVKVRLTIKQQILDMYAAELAKHDQSLVQTEPFLNHVRQIKKDNIPPLPYLDALEGCIRALGHCGYMTSERPNTPQVNGDEAREVIVVEQMVEINIKKTESKNQVTSQTTDKSPLTFNGVDCIKTASRRFPIKTDVGTVQLETIPVPKIIMQAAENIVVAKIDWSNVRIQKLESEMREMRAFEEKNKTQMMKLEKDIIRVTRQLEDERRRLTQRIEEERSRAKEQHTENEVKLRQLEDERNRVIKQLEEERRRLEEERNRLTSQLDEERKRRETDLMVRNSKHKQEMLKERREMKAFEEKNKTKIIILEQNIARVTRQLEDERRRWAQLIEEERSRAIEQAEKMEIRFTQQEDEKKNVLNQLEEERSRLTLQLEEERRRLTLLLEEDRKRREADLKVMNAKHGEETKQKRKNVIWFVMRLKGRDRLLSDVLGRVEDGHLSQVVRQLLHDFHIRLLGVDSGLNFLMEVPAFRWGEVVQEQLQGVLSDLVPETDRQEVTWSHVTHLESSHDSDLRLGGTMLAPETATCTYQTSTDVQGQAYQQSVEKYCLQCVQKWYPHLHSQTYFLPPLHFNRVPYCVEKIAGKEVLVPQISQSVSAGRRNHGNLTLPPVSDRDVRDDKALQRVLHGMRSLVDNGQQKEVMFVVSQLQFDNYLSEPSFAPAAALLPRPSTLPEHFLQQLYDKGDFDVLIIHRQHGLIILEINSVGEYFSLGNMTEEQEDVMLIKKMKKVTEQLNKAEVVLRHLTSDLKPKINITKSLVMPNIKSSQLQRAINRYPSAGQDLCQCLGVQSVDDAVKLCLLSDQLSDKQTSSEINKSFLQALRLWWQHVVRASGTETLMTSALYEQLLARFCGPATTVEVHSVTAPRLNIRTLGEAVSETGERGARFVLFPQQVDILNRSPSRAFLSGPPGTGKTIVLIMQGLTWLQRGHDVHVVSTWDESRAATFVIEHQLQEIAETSTDKPHVHRHQFDFKKDGEVETAVRRLKSLSEGRQLCVIADEVVCDFDRNRKSFTKFFYQREPLTEFCDKLIVQVPGVFIWGAAVYHDFRPLCLKEVKLTTPLRSPPVVVREVMESWQIRDKIVQNYMVNDVPVRTDGPPVMRIKHRDGHSGHTGDWPLYCVECGHQVARVLTEMDVGRTGESNGPPPLQYLDVLVLCGNYPTDDRVNNNGQVATHGSGLVRGLRDRHVPVRVLKKGDEAAIRDTALGVGDLVTVANCLDVQGLERKVVVVETGFDFLERVLAMSRCTSQLVLID